MPLFKRIVSLLLTDQTTGQQTQIDKLRVAFSCTQTAQLIANPGAFTIYNLSESTRARIRRLDTVVTLLAGYEEDESSNGPRVVYRGNVTFVKHMLEHPDWVTTLETGDGIAAIRQSTSTIGLPSGTRAVDVMNQFISDLGVGVRGISPAISANFKQYEGAFSFMGQTIKGLASVVDSLGGEASIQDEEIQVVPKEAPYLTRTVIVQGDSGLISTPEPIMEAGSGARVALIPYGHRLRTLLNPIVRPGTLIDLRSRSVKGLFYVQTVVHDGDTRGASFSSTMEVVPVGPDLRPNLGLLIPGGLQL